MKLTVFHELKGKYVLHFLISFHTTCSHISKLMYVPLSLLLDSLRLCSLAIAPCWKFCYSPSSPRPLFSHSSLLSFTSHLLYLFFTIISVSSSMCLSILLFVLFSLRFFFLLSAQFLCSALLTSSYYFLEKYLNKKSQKRIYIRF